MNKRAGFRAFATAAAAASLILAGTGVATAQPVGPTATFLVCMKVVDSGITIDLQKWVRVKNNCAWTYDVKVVWNNAPDGVCKSLSPGKTRYSEAIPSGSYEGTAIC